MAYTGGVGKYLSDADITNNLAKAFLDISGSDLGVYFDYADAQIESICRKNNVYPAGIALDGNGDLYDVNLRQYGLCHFYMQLFSDKTGKQNMSDSSNLSNSYSFDKYEVQINRYRQSITDYAKQITNASIMNLVTNGDSTITIFEMRRA